MWRILLQQVYLIEDCVQRLNRFDYLFKMTSRGPSRFGIFECFPFDLRRACRGCLLLLFFV
jgi:hypothetical protein